MSRKFFPFALVLFCITSVCHAGKIYKWVDENGVTQYGTQPPPKQNANEFKTRPGSNSSRTISTARTGGTDGYDEKQLFAKWFINRNGLKYSLWLGKHMYILSKVGEHNSKDRISGRVTVSGKKITVTYERHEDKQQIGTTEIFYVSSVNEKELVLVSDTTNKSHIYRKEDQIAASRNSRSAIASNMIGKWQSSGQDDSLILKRGKFIIEGVRKENYINRVISRRGKKYDGLWRVDDPYLYLDVHRDHVYQLEGTENLSGSQIKYQIMENDGERMVLLKAGTRENWTLIKTVR